MRPRPSTTSSLKRGFRPMRSSSTEGPAKLRGACCSAVRSLTHFDAETPMQRLLADNAAAGMLGMARALNGLTGVIDPRDVIRVKGGAHLRVADWMPAFVNAVRVLFAVGTISLFWVVSAWPNGVAAITFCAVIVILLPPSGDAAYSASVLFLYGSATSALLAAIVVFGILPQVTTFPTLCLTLGLVLVPLGFFNARGWKPMFFFAAAVNFLPMLGITNGMIYDASGFWNGAIAILAGIAFGVVAMLLIPSLSPAIRTQRLLSLTLKDFRRLVSSSFAGKAGRLGEQGRRPPAGDARQGRTDRARRTRCHCGGRQRDRAPSSYRAALCPGRDGRRGARGAR